MTRRSNSAPSGNGRIRTRDPFGGITDVAGRITQSAGDGTLHGVSVVRVFARSAGVNRAALLRTIDGDCHVPKLEMRKRSHANRAITILGFAHFGVERQVIGIVAVTPTQAAHTEGLIQDLSHVTGIDVCQVDAARNRAVRIRGQFAIEDRRQVCERNAG